MVERRSREAPRLPGCKNRVIRHGHDQRGVRFVGEVLRITFNYENRTSSTPESIAAKFANRDPRIKTHASALTVKEANVYRHLGPDSEFIMPKCYFSDSEPETGDCAILIEDLGRGAGSAIILAESRNTMQRRLPGR